MTKAEYAKATYEKYKSLGKCPKCGKSIVDDNHVYCEKCRKDNYEYIRSSRKFYQQMGLCPYCKKQRLFNGEKMCIECKAKRYADYKPVKRNRTEEIRERRKKREEQGLCIKCGKRKPQQGRKQCSICLAKDREYKKSRQEHVAEYRREHGLCRFCGERAVTGKQYCKRHYEEVCSQLQKVRPKGNKYWKEQNNLVFRKEVRA